jgi:hypothetical protein
VETGLPADIRTLIVERIGSVVELEVLLLLHAAPTRAWTATDVAAQLRIDPTWSTAQLDGLAGRGLLRRTDDPAASEPTYRYEPADADLDRAVAGLGKAYTDMRVSVISLIYSKPSDNLKTFADAFRIRKEKG